MALPRILQDGNRELAQFAFDGSIAVTKGDLLFHDTNDVKPASSVSAVSEAADQLTLSAAFAGIAADSRPAAETAALTNFPVLVDVDVEMDCVSATWEVGDLVAATYNSGSALVNQVLVKTTNPALAIGFCLARAGSAVTRNKFRLKSKVIRQSGISAVTRTATGEVTGFVAGSGTASKSDSVWAGASGSSAYTVGDIVTALKANGILGA